MRCKSSNHSTWKYITFNDCLNVQKYNQINANTTGISIINQIVTNRSISWKNRSIFKLFLIKIKSFDPPPQIRYLTTYIYKTNVSICRCNTIWCNYHDWKLIMLIVEKKLHHHIKFYDQHDCHDRQDLIRFGPRWKPRFQSLRIS